MRSQALPATSTRKGNERPPRAIGASFSRVPAIAGALAARGTRALVVLTAGLGHAGDAGGKDLSAALLAQVRPHGTRVLGPNCIGLLRPRLRLNVDGDADINGDGVPDFAIGSSDTVQVLSSSPLALSAPTHLISRARGGMQSLAIAGGAARAGAPYWLLGSVSGRRPGVGLGQVVVPLNPDAYMLHTLLQPNAPPLVASFGTLDAGGNAQASFALPARLPLAFLGLTFDHAYVVLSGWQPVFASYAVPVTIGPQVAVPRCPSPSSR